MSTDAFPNPTGPVATAHIAEQILARLSARAVSPRVYPNADAVVGCVRMLRRVLFPELFEAAAFANRTAALRIQGLLAELSAALSAQIRIALEPNGEAEAVTARFLAGIPRLAEVLESDAEAILLGDPAATGLPEVILTYPGFYAILVYRAAHELHRLSVPLIPRMMTEHAHSVTGIDLHPAATIGKHFCIDHGTGIVVGETAVIGEHVKLYQGVTLGALSTQSGQKLKNVKRHPTILDSVTVYSGASVLGGDTVVGERAVIGGNAFIVKSVPADTVVRMQPQRPAGKPGDA